MYQRDGFRLHGDFRRHGPVLMAGALAAGEVATSAARSGRRAMRTSPHWDADRSTPGNHLPTITNSGMPGVALRLRARFSVAASPACGIRHLPVDA